MQAENGDASCRLERAMKVIRRVRAVSVNGRNAHVESAEVNPCDDGHQQPPSGRCQYTSQPGWRVAATCTGAVAHNELKGTFWSCQPITSASAKSKTMMPSSTSNAGVPTYPRRVSDVGALASRKSEFGDAVVALSRLQHGRREVAMAGRVGKVLRLQAEARAVTIHVAFLARDGAVEEVP